MGFGIVLSGRGRDRIITERIVLAMPENGIGLFPDVVFAYIAAQSPGEGAVGAYLGLTGNRISTPYDAPYVGLGAHHVPFENLDSLKKDLLATTFCGHCEIRSNQIRKSKRCWNNIAQTQSEPRLKLLLPQIISTFGGNKSVEEIMNELEKHQESADTLARIASIKLLEDGGSNCLNDAFLIATDYNNFVVATDDESVPTIYGDERCINVTRNDRSKDRDGRSTMVLYVVANHYDGVGVMTLTEGLIV
ncbi:3-hydroxyisobutyryl- hydrolase 3, mitochondrial isoform X1 [Olea europaea subsp. europaea]|uniref:3-hydroxyisobutyryl-CoA hydrolase n=1 Tax=Olea europaea subsp. europaea TaxID=158383 RepID=A0A8S0QG58_OLEEU|nr:3-hydroxyisobutyryl- hydrolase 3, mitochondrial isoform X1 [Olea europaea subsp. europaea]